MIARYSKAIGALLGGVTPSVVIYVLGLVGVHVGLTVATAIVAVVAAITAGWFPANTPKPAPPAPPAPPSPTTT